MDTRHLRRSLAAVATTIACVITMANPAGAVVHDGQIAGGVITFVKAFPPVSETLELVPTPATCPRSRASSSISALPA